MTQVDPDTRAMLRLAMTPGVGPIMIARLREHFGSLQALFGASIAQLCEVRGVSTERARAISNGVDDQVIEAELAQATERGVQLISIDDARYPPLLKTIPDPPPILYVRGELRPDDAYAIAVVGTRDCSAYGSDQAGRLSAGLAQAGLTIVSGGARGIDSESHRGALRGGGRTIVVTGCGLSNVYPPENAELFERIVHERCGALVSEFSMCTQPARENFPRRNRIISGLSLGTLVVEADEHSGALITARLACEDHNREVMALPGRADARQSAGCNKMIREGWARLVTSVPEILESLKGSEHLMAGIVAAPSDLFEGPGAAPTSDQKKEERTGPPPGLTPSQVKIFNALADGQPTEIGDLAARTGLAVHVLQADLTMLQIRGLVARVGPASVGLTP